MSSRLLVLADTHLPKRARDLAREVWRQVESVDVVIHAGDWVDVRLLDELEARSRRLVGVHGNNDHGALRDRLPEVARVELEGLRLGVVHETGQAKGREARCSELYPDLDVLVFGHSHIPWDTTTATGLRLLNPGSPTDRRRQPFCTYMTATVEAGELADVVLHRLTRDESQVTSKATPAGPRASAAGLGRPTTGSTPGAARAPRGRRPPPP